MLYTVRALAKRLAGPQHVSPSLALAQPQHVSYQVKSSCLSRNGPQALSRDGQARAGTSAQRPVASSPDRHANQETNKPHTKRPRIICLDPGRMIFPPRCFKHLHGASWVPPRLHSGALKVCGADQSCLNSSIMTNYPGAFLTVLFEARLFLVRP